MLSQIEVELKMDHKSNCMLMNACTIRNLHPLARINTLSVNDWFFSATP